MKHHEFLFDPENLKAEADRLRVEDYKLTIRELVEYGNKLTLLRSEITERADVFKELD